MDGMNAGALIVGLILGIGVGGFFGHVEGYVKGAAMVRSTECARVDNPLSPAQPLVRFDGQPALWLCTPITPTTREVH